jgi:hypothetical protein
MAMLGFCKYLLWCLGMCGLAAVILWQVVESCGARYGQAIVHVSEPGTLIMVDDVTQSVNAWHGAPFVFDILPGKHRALLLRKGVIIDDQTFETSQGGDFVLALCDQKQYGQVSVPMDVAGGRRSRGMAEEMSVVRQP